MGSGNVVHNLSQVRLDGGVHDWALEFDSVFVNAIENRNMKQLTQLATPLLDIAHPTLDHYIPSIDSRLPG